MKRVHQLRALAKRSRLGFAVGAVTLAGAALGGPPHVDPAEDARHFGPPEAFLFWNAEQKVAGFRNIASIYPTRIIAAGNAALPLLPAATPIEQLSFEANGEPLDIDGFMERNHIVGLMAVQNDKVFLERYAAGNDEHSLWVSFSVAKSVVAMLVGAAIQDGFIESAQEKVTSYLPRLAGTAYDDVAIADLLRMSSGVAWNEDYADPDSDVNTMPPNLVALYRELATKERVGAAGELFNYNTAETNLVGAVLRAAIGNNLATYLTHKVWRPFGMQAAANWMTHGPDGGELGGCCISATLRDYARIGLFALADGVLPNGERVLPEGWMAESTAPAPGYAGYGYLWWLQGGGEFDALGIFGQSIHVDPARRLVVVTHSAWPTAVGDEFDERRASFLAALARHLDDNPI